jgi:hypothetical protein
MTQESVELLLRIIDEIGILVLIILWIFGRYRTP